MRYALLLVPFLAAGCAPPPSQVADPDGVAVSDVIRRVKLELSLYQEYELKHRTDLSKQNYCNGYVNFHITKVQMTLQTMRMVDLAASGSIAMPVPIPFKLGVSAGGHHISKNTQTIALSIFPFTQTGQVLDAKSKDDQDKIKQDAPLSESLVGAREAILAESERMPCYHLRPDDKPVGNTVSFLMDVERKGNAGFDFSYSILSLGASRSTDYDYNNKIEITFEPYLDPLVNGQPPKAPDIPRGASVGEGFFGATP